jgi:hypothetical protein
VIGELIDLSAFNLAAGKGAAQRIDANVLRLDVAGGFVDLPVQLRGLDPSALAIGSS